MSGPYQTTIGRVPTDFTRPVNPAFAAPSLIGAIGRRSSARMTVRAAARASISQPLGLERIRYVRIDGNCDVRKFSPEIDAIADVAPQAPMRWTSTATET
jgi:hypothetical protein